MSLTHGIDQSKSMPRKSIKKGQHIPDLAIFIKRTAIEFLQTIYSTRAEGSMKWRENIEESEIQISDVNAVNLSQIGKRPAIIVVRGQISAQGMGLGGSAFEGMKMTTGQTAFNDLMHGSLALNCISREGIEAEQIAGMVFNLFKFFAPELRKLGYYSIKGMSIGAESLIRSTGVEDELTLVPVFVQVQVQERFGMEESVARALRQIIIETFQEV